MNEAEERVSLTCGGELAGFGGGGRGAYDGLVLGGETGGELRRSEVSGLSLWEREKTAHLSSKMSSSIESALDLVELGLEGRVALQCGTRSARERQRGSRAAERKRTWKRRSWQSEERGRVVGGRSGKGVRPVRGSGHSGRTRVEQRVEELDLRRRLELAARVKG